MWENVRLFALAIGIVFTACVIAKPVKPDQKKPDHSTDTKSNPENIYESILGNETLKYFDEVIEILESHPKCREKMQNITADNLASSELEKCIHDMDPEVRTKLDELKRWHYEQLQLQRKLKAKDGKDRSIYGHLHEQDRKFVPQDLSKMVKTIDDIQQKHFKESEMDKKMKHEMDMKKMNETAKKQAEEELAEHKRVVLEEAKKVSHPGSKHSLEDAIEADGYDTSNFDPNALFKMHDYNEDDHLDQRELETIFRAEVLKLKHLDSEEKAHELDNMVHHYLKENDLDGDGAVSRHEFERTLQLKEYNDDEGWDVDLDPFSDDEYQGYIKDHGFDPMGDPNQYPYDNQIPNVDHQAQQGHQGNAQQQHQSNNIPQQQQAVPQKQPVQQQQIHSNNIPQQPQQGNVQQNAVPQQQQQQQQQQRRNN